jgi:hypothetical protein
MASKSTVQKLIERYESEITEHQRAIEAKKGFITALVAAQKAQTRAKPRKGSNVTVAQGSEDQLFTKTSA